MGLNKSCRPSLLFDLPHQKDKNVGHNIEQNSGEEKLEAAVGVLTTCVHAHNETFTRET